MLRSKREEEDGVLRWRQPHHCRHDKGTVRQPRREGGSAITITATTTITPLARVFTIATTVDAMVTGTAPARGKAKAMEMVTAKAMATETVME